MEVVYSITNKLNNKKYIGSTVNYDKRVKSHLRGLRGEYHENRKLQDAFDAHGVDNFIFDIIYELEDGSEKERFRLEEEFITIYNSYMDGYNLSYDGRGRYEITEKTREKMIKNSLGEGNPFYGNEHTEETRQKLSKIASEKIGEKNPFYGKSHTEQTKQQISQSIKKFYASGNESPQKGIPKSEEHILKNLLAQPSRKNISVDGKTYPSISSCAKELNLSRATIRKRLNSDEFNDYFFLSDK